MNKIILIRDEAKLNYCLASKLISIRSEWRGDNVSIVTFIFDHYSFSIFINLDNSKVCKNIEKLFNRIYDNRDTITDAVSILSYGGME